MYICISDLHIGHLKITAELIYQKLLSQFYPYLNKCKGIFIAGDFFDQLITMDSTGAHYSTTIIQDLIQSASEHGFFIRVLRGTFGHDRNQLKLFETISKYYQNVDLKYFDKIDIECINNSHNLKILYLPDSLPYKSADAVLSHVHELLDNVQIPKVDLVIGHGYFEHVLPPAAIHHTKIIYTHDMFKDIVNGYVIFGHVHTHSAYKNIVYCGSFERLAHGEEEPKGFLMIEKDPWKCTFIKNNESTLFVSVNIKQDLSQLESILEQLQKTVQSKFKDKTGHLRLIVTSSELKVALLSRVPYLFPTLNITIKISDGSPDEPVVLESDMFESLELDEVPTPDTLPEDVFQYLKLYKPSSNLNIDIITNKLSILMKTK